MENEKQKITITKDGPYLVTSNIPLKQEIIEPNEEGGSTGYGEGRKYDNEGKSYALCRCGHSENKPYCDGHHAQIGWDGTETASREIYDDVVRVYEGGTVDMLDRKELCAVGRFCDVVNAWKMAMMSDEGHPEYEEIAIKEACGCPSGRLTIRKDGIEIEPELEKGISLLEDKYYDTKGPLFVKGGIAVQSADGSEYEIRNRRTLCRCGESGNLPFCDASHLKCEHMKGLDV